MFILEVRAVIGIIPDVYREKRSSVGLSTSVQSCIDSNRDDVSEAKLKVKESQVSVL